MAVITMGARYNVKGSDEVVRVIALHETILTVVREEVVINDHPLLGPVGWYQTVGEPFAMPVDLLGARHGRSIGPFCTTRIEGDGRPCPVHRGTKCP